MEQKVYLVRFPPEGKWMLVVDAFMDPDLVDTRNLKCYLCGYHISPGTEVYHAFGRRTHPCHECCLREMKELEEEYDCTVL